MLKGEIWLVDLSDGKGREQKGERPAILAGGENGLFTAIPLTNNTDLLNLPSTYLIEPTRENGLAAPSVALIFQIVALDKTRFKRRIGCIAGNQQTAIDELLKGLLKLK